MARMGHASVRGAALALAVLSASGCFRYEQVPFVALPHAQIDEARVRVTTDEGVIELDEARLRYPTIHGDVRSNTRPDEEPRLGTLASLDVEQAHRIEVRRISPGPTAVIVTGSALTGIAGGVFLFAIAVIAMQSRGIP